MTPVLAANAAIPVGLRRKVALDSTALTAATKHAAGILFVAPDGDVLMLRRSPKEENFAGHWSLPGGNMDEGETPPIGASREAKEEMGVDVDPAKFKVFDQTITPTGKAFHTFVMPADKKFWPTINDEHVGAGWFPLSELPRPIHPAVEASLKGRLGDDFAGASDGLAAWSKLSDEEAERLAADDVCGTCGGTGELAGPGIKCDDCGGTGKKVGATDSVFLIAMDRDSVREKTRDGRLIVKKTHISKANVCPYRGKEIPGWEALGLEPDRVYNLLRDPDELQKAAPTLNGVQLLIKHIPVSAADHRPDETVGSLGSDAEFDGEYLDNSLFVNAKHAIDAIESGRQRELSAGYHYKPDMTPGNFRGTAFDGVMRDIVFNHVALVEDGRAGPDVVVGDAALKEQDMKKATRFGAMTLSIAAAQIAPLLAMDSKVTLPKDLFAPLTTKNFKDSREKLLSGVRSAIDGKLRTGIALDGSMQNFAKAIDAFNDNMTGGIDEPAPEDKQADMDAVAAVEPAKGITEPGATYDAEPMKAFMKQCGMDDAMISKCMDMMPKPALDSDETPEEKAAREKKESEEKAAKDAALAAKDAEMKDMVTKPAMDAAIQTAVIAAKKQVQETERGIRVALVDVKPWVGELPVTLAFDSAESVYRKAASMLNIDGADKLHADALFPVIKAQPKPGARPPEHVANPALAMDASAVTKAIKMAPGLEHISTTL